ncbi:MAG: ribose-phosphate diphosphokinase [Chloroflexi bacterium]|nr:ribose-phosphate diphosphokinase [Chloroflexota bacterium]MQC26995.1 ribose-phosphate diphosphokinase [Chloroflexota bacterium]
MAKAKGSGNGLYGSIKLFTGTANPELAQKISDYLDVPLSGRDLVEFSNDNLMVRLHGSVRGQDVYVIQSTSRPVHRSLMELLITLQTLRYDSAARITAVVPYMSYARSDKKDQPRVPIVARLVADMIEVAGADRYVTLDLHAGQIQGFFSIPGDVLTAFHILGDYAEKLCKKLKDPVVVSVDLGFAKRARNFAERINVPLALIEKRRSPDDAKTEAFNLVGDVEGRDVILVDDEVDTAGSVDDAVKLLAKIGARSIYLFFVHAVLSDPAVDRLSSLPLTGIITTDTVPISEDRRKILGDKLTILTVAPLLGEVIRRAHEGRSVGAMFDE